MKSLIIPIHSFVDVITNSSSEIYVSADKNTVSAVKSIINNLLKGVGSDKTSDDLFDICVGVEIDNPTPYKERKPGEPWNIIVPIDSELGKAKVEEYSGDYPKQSDIMVTPKPGTDENIALAAKTLSNLTGLFSIDSQYNG